MMCPTCSCRIIDGTLIIGDLQTWAAAPCPCPTCEVEARWLMCEAGKSEASKADVAMLGRIMGAIGIDAGAGDEGLESTGNGPGVAPGGRPFVVPDNLGPSGVWAAGPSLGNST